MAELALLNGLNYIGSLIKKPQQKSILKNNITY